MAAQYVIFAVDQARLVSPFPQGPGAGVPGIEQADVVGAESLHQTANVTCILRGHEEVDMLVHPAISMQTPVLRRQRLPPELTVNHATTILQDQAQEGVAPRTPLPRA